MHSPTDASPPSLRTATHGLGPIGSLLLHRIGLAPTAHCRSPGALQTILASRIDRLSAEHKRLLQAASVVGKDVALPLLEAIADMPGDAFREGLAQLQAAEFIYETQLFPEIEYTFKHALTHEVAYGSLLAERRRTLHATIVDAIERLYGPHLTEHVEILAHHAVRGRVADKAVRYLREAAAKAAARSANREAVEFFAAALENVKALPRSDETLRTELNICIQMGPALIALKGASSTEVENLYLRARDLVDQLDDATERVPALWGLWYVRSWRGQYEEARTAGERLHEAADTRTIADSCWKPTTRCGRRYRAAGARRLRSSIRKAGSRSTTANATHGRRCSTAATTPVPAAAGTLPRT